MPIIPYISDSLSNLRQLVKFAKKSDAEFILFRGLTLKPRRQKAHFLETVRKHDYEKLGKIKEIYSNDNQYGQPDSKKLPINVMAVGHAICRENGVNPRSIRHSCPGEFKNNHLILSLLLDEKYWMSTFLGYPKREWDYIHRLAAKLEYGLQDLSIAYNECLLDSILESKELPIVEEILNKVDSFSKAEYKKIDTEYTPE